MSLSYYPINLKFTTDSADYDILQNTEVKGRLQTRYGWDETRYQKEVEKGLRNINFDIFCKDTQVKINDGDYQELIANAGYFSDDFLNFPIKSIKIKDTAIEVILSIKIS